MNDFKTIPAVFLLLFFAVPVSAENISLKVEEDPKAISENYALSLFELGKELYEAKLYETAIAYFLEAERVSSNKTKGTSSKFAAMFKDEFWDNKENYYFLGLAYRDSKSFKKAIEAFKKITELDKENYDAFLLIGQTYIATNKKEYGSEAVSACKKAVKIKEDFADGYICIAKGSMVNNIKKSAVKALEKALEINPRDMPSYKMVIEIIESTNKPEEAEPFKEKLAILKGVLEGD